MLKPGEENPGTLRCFLLEGVFLLIPSSSSRLGTAPKVIPPSRKLLFFQKTFILSQMIQMLGENRFARKFLFIYPFLSDMSIILLEGNVTYGASVREGNRSCRTQASGD